MVKRGSARGDLTMMPMLVVPRAVCCSRGEFRHELRGEGCWQLVPGRECADELAVSVCQCADRDDQAIVRATGECRNGRFNLADVPHDQWTQFHSERRRHPLDCGQLADTD